MALSDDLALLADNTTGNISAADMRTALQSIYDALNDDETYNDTITDALDDAIDGLASVYVPLSLVDAKGDLFTATAADTPARQAVGTDGKILVANSGATNGLNWQYDQFVPLGPSGALAQTMPRNLPHIAAVVLVSGTLRLHAVHLYQGQVVTNIGFMSATGVTGPQNWWFGLYDSSRVGLALTADQTTTAWASNTSKVLALTAPFTATYTGLHYVGCNVTSSGSPGTQYGVQPTNTGPNSLTPILSGASTTGLTTPPTAGNPGGVGGTAGALTASGSYSYAWIT